MIIDGVSGTGAGVRAAENCIEFLDEYSDLAVNIDFHKLRANVHMPSASLPSLQWSKLARSAARESDWTLLTFPVETQFSFAHSGWPYDPFIGPQEDRDHEKRGLAKIADAMFNEPEFAGFHIAGGYRLFTENAMRRIDGVLVSPWGVVLLELKDHRGVITLDPTNRHCGLVKQVDGHESIETNPVNKLDEGLIAFKNCNLGAAIDTRLRNIGAVVFTHPQAQVTCFHANKPRTKLPQSGVMLIDFGLACARRQQTEGSSLYQAPEQSGHRHFNLTHAVGIFALGQVGWWLLTGAPLTLYPNDEYSDWDNLEDIQLSEGRDVLSKKAYAIARKALAFQPAKRWARAADMGYQIKQLLDEQRRASGPR